jgi:excisionase family DNA binding protein
MASERLTYTIEETAGLLGVGRGTCYEAARRNELPVPVIRIGRRLLVSKAGLDAVLGLNKLPSHGRNGHGPADEGPSENGAGKRERAPTPER